MPLYRLVMTLSDLVMLREAKGRSGSFEPSSLSDDFIGLLGKIKPVIRRQTCLILSACMKERDGLSLLYRHDLDQVDEENQPYLPLSMLTAFLKKQVALSQLGFADIAYYDTKRDCHLMLDGRTIIAPVLKQLKGCYQLFKLAGPGRLSPQPLQEILGCINERFRQGHRVALCLDIDDTALLRKQSIAQHKTVLNPAVTSFLSQVWQLFQKCESPGNLSIQLITRRKYCRATDAFKLSSQISNVLTNPDTPQSVSSSLSIVTILQGLVKQLPWLPIVCHRSCPHLGGEMSKRAWVDNYYEKDLLGRSRRNELRILVDDSPKERDLFDAGLTNVQLERGIELRSLPVSVCNTPDTERSMGQIKKLEYAAGMQCATNALVARHSSPGLCGAARPRGCSMEEFTLDSDLGPVVMPTRC